MVISPVPAGLLGLSLLPVREVVDAFRAEIAGRAPAPAIRTIVGMKEGVDGCLPPFGEGYGEIFVRKAEFLGCSA